MKTNALEVRLSYLDAAIRKMNAILNYEREHGAAVSREDYTGAVVNFLRVPKYVPNLQEYEADRPDIEDSDRVIDFTSRSMRGRIN